MNLRARPNSSWSCDAANSSAALPRWSTATAAAATSTATGATTSAPSSTSDAYAPGLAIDHVGPPAPANHSPSSNSQVWVVSYDLLGGDREQAFLFPPTARLAAPRPPHLVRVRRHRPARTLLRGPRLPSTARQPDPNHETITASAPLTNRPWPAPWSSRCGCVQQPGWSASVWSPWTPPRWPLRSRNVV